MMRNESQELLSKVASALEVSVSKAVAAAIERHGVPTKTQIQAAETTSATPADAVSAHT